MSTILGIDQKYVAVTSVALSAGIAAFSLYKLRQLNSITARTDPKSTGSTIYESNKLLSEYLVFHFGKPEQLIPYSFGPKDALDFPKRCAELCLKHYKKQDGIPDRALDIGCAVGRSSFELAQHVTEVIGIDYSNAFVDAANILKKNGSMDYSIVQEGDITVPALAEVDKSINREHVSFEQGDACNLRPTLGQFGVVLAANLVCRLQNPTAFLHRLSSLMPHSGAILVITAPYTWLADYTDKNVWLGGYRDSSGKNVTGFDGLKRELSPSFDLIEDVNMPFFIRETARKNQWTVAHATVWRRK